MVDQQILTTFGGANGSNEFVFMRIWNLIHVVNFRAFVKKETQESLGEDVLIFTAYLCITACFLIFVNCILKKMKSNIVTQ